MQEPQFRLLKWLSIGCTIALGAYRLSGPRCQPRKPKPASLSCPLLLGRLSCVPVNTDLEGEAHDSKEAIDNQSEATSTAPSQGINELFSLFRYLHHQSTCSPVLAAAILNSPVLMAINWSIEQHIQQRLRHSTTTAVPYISMARRRVGLV